MLRKGTLKLHTLQLLVLDEADKLFEMGFLEQVDEIVACGSTLFCCCWCASIEILFGNGGR